jgi:hypothetical protein
MKAIAQTAAMLAYIVLALLQCGAEIAGLHEVLGWPSFFCWIAAFLTAWIPLVGTAAGIWGAHSAWQWDWMPSFALFLGTPLFFLAMVGILTAIDSMRTRRLAK